MSGLYPDPLYTVSWNPIEGCTPISEGCKNCWALNMRRRFGGGEVLGQPPVTEPVLRPDRLEAPLRRRKPTIYAVAFMGDLFHDQVSNEFIDKVFAVMAVAGMERVGRGLQTFLLLTKRPERMKEYICWRDEEINVDRQDRIAEAMENMGFGDFLDCYELPWPLPNVWLGVSCENQARADERIPLLLETPAAHRWVSLEPLLGKIDLEYLNFRPSPEGQRWINSLRGFQARRGWEGEVTPCSHLDWCVIGGESGPHARPCDLGWIRDVRDQCKAAGVPCYVKQLGTDWRNFMLERPAWPALTPDYKGEDMAFWPPDLRVRETPEGRPP